MLFCSKVFQGLGIVFFSLVIVSCSSKKAKNNSSKIVSKEKYDKLLKSYNDLLAKSMNKSKTLLAKEKSFDVEKIDLIDELKKNPPGQAKDFVKGVDTFKNSPGKKKLPNINLDKNERQSYIIKDVESDLKKLFKAYRYLNQNKLNKSLKTLRLLETSSVRQIRVHAKFYIGDILFRQQEYDLAMQIFEEILDKDAFSGIVIKTLGRLVACSEKLKLPKKKERYFSMLHDFFGHGNG